MKALKEENDRLYKVALQLDNSLAEKKKKSFTMQEFTASVKVMNGNPIILLNQLVAYGFVVPIELPKGHFVIQYFPKKRKETLTKLIEGMQQQIDQITDQKRKIETIKELI